MFKKILKIICISGMITSTFLWVWLFSRIMIFGSWKVYEPNKLILYPEMFLATFCALYSLSLIKELI